MDVFVALVIVEGAGLGDNKAGLAMGEFYAITR
jgi:hypothetical protein